MKFKRDIIDKDSDFRVPNAYFASCAALNIFLAVVLVYWWMSRGFSANPWFDSSGNWNLFDIYSNATVVTQWGAVLVVGVVLNGFLYRRFAGAAA